MRHLKVSSNVLIAVALICTIQYAISLKIDSKDNNSQWETLNKSTDKNELKISSIMCLKFINNINEQFKNTKKLSDTKLHEHNKTTKDIVNLAVDIKKIVQKTNLDIFSVRKLVQNIAIRFRDAFKSVVSLSELECEPANEELESIKNTVVDKSKPSVNSVIKAFGNRHNLSRVANEILKTSSDSEIFKDNYDKKQKKAEEEFFLLWNILDYYLESINNDALITFTTFFKGIKVIKSVKQKINSFEKEKIYNKIEEADITNLKNAVELAKALKLKFVDDWNLDSGELNYSEERQKADKSLKDDKQSQIKDNIVAVNNDKPDTMEPEIQEIVQDFTNNNNNNNNNNSIKKTPLLSPITKNKDQTDILQQEIPIEIPSFTDNSSNIDDVHTQIENTQSTSEKENKEQLTNIPSEIPMISKDKQNRKERQILQWEDLIKQANSLVRQESIKCVNTLKAIIADLDTINLLAKTSIQAIKNHADLKNTENNIVQQFNIKMIDTNRKLANSLVNGAGEVCTKVTPINTKLITKFDNDQNIKRIKNLLGEKYDPNKYISKILYEAKKLNGNGSIKKMSYNKMLLVIHNIKNETKEMDYATLYAMNKIHEGALAESDLSKILNNEKASKACYIRNILLEKENDADKKSKDKNEKKVQEYINENNVSLDLDDKQEDDYEHADEQENTELLDSVGSPKNYVKQNTIKNPMKIITITDTKQKQPGNMHSNTQRDEPDIDNIILRPKEIQTDEKEKTPNLDSDSTKITGKVNDVNELENSITENSDLKDNIPENKNNDKEKVSVADAGEQTKIPEKIDAQIDNIQPTQQELSDPRNNELDGDTDHNNTVITSPKNEKHDGIVRTPKKGNDYVETKHMNRDDDNFEHPSLGIRDNEKKITPIYENNSQKNEYNKRDTHNSKLDNFSNDIETLKGVPNENIDSVENVEQPIIRNDNNISAVSSYEPYSTSMEEEGYDPTDEQGSTELFDSDVSPTTYVKKYNINYPLREVSKTSQNKKQPNNKPGKIQVDELDMDNITHQLKKKNYKKDKKPNIEDSNTINLGIINDDNGLEMFSIENDVPNDNNPKDNKNYKENMSETNTKEQTKIPETTDTHIDNIQHIQRELSDSMNNVQNGEADQDNIVMSSPKKNKHNGIVRKPKNDYVESKPIIHDDNGLENSSTGIDILKDNITESENSDKKKVSKTDTKEKPKILETIDTQIGNIQPIQQKLSDPMNNELKRDTDPDNIVMSIPRKTIRKRIVEMPKEVTGDFSDNISKKENRDKEKVSETDTGKQMKIPEKVDTQVGNIQPIQKELTDPMNDKLDKNTDHNNIVMTSPKKDIEDDIMRRPMKINDYVETTHIIDDDNRFKKSSIENDIINDTISKNDNNDKGNVSAKDIKEQPKSPETIDTQIGNIQPIQQKLSDPMNNELDEDIDNDNIDMSIPRKTIRKRILGKPKEGTGDSSDNVSKIENNEKKMSETDIGEQTEIPKTIDKQIGNKQPTQQKLTDPMNDKQDKNTNHNNIIMTSPRKDIKDETGDLSDNISKIENNNEKKMSETDIGERTEVPETIDTQIGNNPPTQQELSDTMNNELDGDIDNDNIDMSIPRKNKRKRIVRRPKIGNEDFSDNISKNDNNDKENVSAKDTKEQMKIPETTDTQIGNKQPTQQELSDQINNELDGDINNDNIDMSIPRKNKRKRIVRRPKIENEDFSDNISKNENSDKEKLSKTNIGEQMRIPETTDTQIGNKQPTQQELSDTMNNELDGDIDNDNIDISIPRKNKRKRIVRRPKIGNGDFYDNMRKNENTDEGKGSEVDTGVQSKIPATIVTQIDDILPSQHEFPDPMVNVLGNVDEKKNDIESEPNGTSLLSKPPINLMDDNEIIDEHNTYPVQNNGYLNVVDDDDDEVEEENVTSLSNQNKKKMPKQRRRRRKITTTKTNRKTTTTEDNPLHYVYNYDSDIGNEHNLPESSVELSKGHSPRPKRTRRVRRIKPYSVDKKGNERIPNEGNEFKKSISDDIDKDSGDFSSFLFKENNADQCKRYAYDSFKTVSTHDAKIIAFESITNTSELNSNVLATIGNAINNVKASMTFDDVDQSIRTVSNILKTGLKQAINEVLTKVIPLAKNIMETAENTKVFYQKGPQSTYKMLTNVLESEPEISDLAKGALNIISPGFNVDEMIDNIFDTPYSDMSLKQRRDNAQRKLIDLSIHMDTVISNIDCFILFTMASIGNGASTLKSLKSRKVIMTDEHPRMKALRDTIGIIKLVKNIRNRKTVKTVNSNGAKENSVSNSDKNPDRTFQKRNNVLTPKPNINNSKTTPRSITVNRERTFGVIVMYPNREIMYQKMANLSNSDEFIMEVTNKYTRMFGAEDHPVFLKVHSRKEIATLIEKVKKMEGYGRMSNIAIRNEITKMLKNNRIVF